MSKVKTVTWYLCECGLWTRNSIESFTMVMELAEGETPNE